MKYYFLLFLIFCSLFSCKKLSISTINKIQTGDFTKENDQFALKGKIIDIKKGGVYQFGHCWSVNETPTLLNASSYTSFFKGEIGDEFVSYLNHIELDKKYFYTTYTISNEDTTYFEAKEFTINANAFDLPNFSTNINSYTTLTQNSVQIDVSSNFIEQFKIIEQGVCFSKTNTNPTILDSKNGISSNLSNYSINLNDLTKGETYYCKSFIRFNENKIVYSQVTEIAIEKIRIKTLGSTLNNNIATLIGSIEQIGLENINDHGFCWSTSTSNPSYNDNKIQIGQTSTLGNFYGDINLSPNTTYYFRSFAVVGNEIIYGEIKNIQF
jgi:hypothetical protein